MISFDTFTGQLHDPSSGSSSGEDTGKASGASVTSDDTADSGAEMPSRCRLAADAEHDADSLATGSDDSDTSNPYDLFHERTAPVAAAPSSMPPSPSPSNAGSRRHRKHRKSSAAPPLPPPPIVIPVPDAGEHVALQNQQEPPTESGGRVLQLFHLLTFKNQASDAKSALVQRLVAVTNVKELIMSKATEEQIASAANDAITDEILASVDLEDKRRQSVTSFMASGQATPNCVETGNLVAALDEDSSRAVITTGHYSPYRVLELVDVLDSTTGGMVKLILTNVRRRAPFSQRSRRSKAIEFCSFCTAYSDHTAAQHRCRICGAAGQHRSKSCPKSASSPSSFTPPPRSKTPETSTGGKSYCTFCSALVNHTTQTHQCRNCGTLGAHRSRSCNKKPTGRGNRWVGSPIEQFRERRFCDLCGTWRYHTSNEHKCSICSVAGEHRSMNCPLKVANKSPGSGGRTPRINPGSRSPATALHFCSFCVKQAAHRSEEHRCRVCQAVGSHRSGECPERANLPQSVLSYSVTTATKVIEKVLPTSATSLVWNSIDKVGDVDTILKKTLQRIGVWGGGSQTPITTPYAPPVGSRESSSSVRIAAPSSSAVNVAGVYVLSYAEGRSVVPERILKYMRLLMHHEISVNAFSVVVRFDPRSSHWELEKPGMVTPRSLPSSPTMSEQLKKRMAKYTLQTLFGAREKLVVMVLEQRKQVLQLQQLQQQSQAQQTHQMNALESAEAPGAVAVNSS